MRFASTVSVPIDVEGQDPLSVHLPTHVYILLRRGARRAGVNFNVYFATVVLNQARADLEGRAS